MKKPKKLVRPPWTPERRRKTLAAMARMRNRKRKLERKVSMTDDTPVMAEADIKRRADKRKEQTAARWTRELAWDSKPPPPQEVVMLINVNGRPVPTRCILSHMHNMPVYLPLFDFPEPQK